MNQIQPYTDDFMRFDEQSGHYVLTEKAITDKCGIDLRARLSQDKTVNADIVINRICCTVSDMIYSFIHEFSICDKRQDCLIATVPELRNAVQKAMEYQMEFFLANGSLYLSVEDSAIGKEIHRMSQNILIDSGICYTGV